MTTATVTPTISLDALPPLGGPLEGGRFAGLTTGKDGKHYAVALLPEQGSDLNHQAAQAWAAALGGTLPTRPVAALLFANLRDQLFRYTRGVRLEPAA